MGHQFRIRNGGRRKPAKLVQFKLDGSIKRRVTVAQLEAAGFKVQVSLPAKVGILELVRASFAIGANPKMGMSPSRNARARA